MVMDKRVARDLCLLQGTNSQGDLKTEKVRKGTGESLPSLTEMFATIRA